MQESLLSNESTDHELSRNELESTLKVYAWRFVIVGLFLLAGFSNALVLLTFSPIADLANTYWNDIGLTAVNLLAVSFQIAYIPGTILALTISKRYNLRTILLTGGSLTTFGCLIRWIGAYAYQPGSSNGLSAASSYAIIFIGTFSVALAQPFYLNLPAKIAAAWFAVKERDIATTICSLANPLGSALGSLIPAIFVSGGNGSDDNSGDVSGVSTLLLTQLIIASIAWGSIIFLFRSEPPSPPSISESQKTTKVARSTWTQLTELLKKTEYVKLLVSFTIALANLNALAALLNQLPGGYSNSQVGLTGFTLIISGFIGAFLAGMVLERSKAYRPLLKFFWLTSVTFWAIFALSCRTSSFAFFLTSGGFLGFSLLPISKSTFLSVSSIN